MEALPCCGRPRHLFDDREVADRWRPRELSCLIIGESPGKPGAAYFYDPIPSSGRDPVEVRRNLLWVLHEVGLLGAPTLEAFKEAGFLFDHAIRCQLPRNIVDKERQLAVRYASVRVTAANHLASLLAEAPRVWIMGHIALNAVAHMDTSISRKRRRIAEPPYPTALSERPTFFVSRYLSRADCPEVHQIARAFRRFVSSRLQRVAWEPATMERAATNPSSVRHGWRNSSITRVRPVFQRLIRSDATGGTWIPRLLELAPRGRPNADEMLRDFGALRREALARRAFRDRVLKHYGRPVIELERCFEWSTPPSRRFLRWLVSNPERLVWPRTHRGSERVFGPRAQRWREMLMGRHGAAARDQAQRAALLAIETTLPSDSGRRWWALEGFTSVDCCLESDRSVLFIEGKRTERLAKSTNWYPGRNQLLRNLEVAQVVVAGRNFGVVVIGESADSSVSNEDIAEGLPHLTVDEQEALMRHYLGCVTWKAVCDATGIDLTELPDTVEEAMAMGNVGEGAQHSRFDQPT